MQKLDRILDKVSPKQLIFSYKARQPTEHLMHSLDQEGFKKLLKYRDDTGHPQYKKYLNARYWLHKNVERALKLNLNRIQPITILDIGCGFGYFPYVAKFYGHDVIGTDLPGDKLFRKAAEFLKVDRRDDIVEPMKPLPDFGKKFDLITAFQVCFNGHIEGNIWGEKEWDFFLEDLFKNHINTGGKIYLELNWSQHIQKWIPDEVSDLFKKKYNAKFDRMSRVTLTAPPASSTNA